MEDESDAVCSRFQDPRSLNALLPDLEQALESAMAASSGGPGGPSLSPGRSYSAAGAGAGQGGRAWGRNRQRVLARLEVVRGVPFYGYHGKEELFVKASEGNRGAKARLACVPWRTCFMPLSRATDALK